MNETDRPHRPDSGRSLIRDVLFLLLLGAALGLASNQIQRAAGSSRALPWLKSERALASLEDSLATPIAPPRDSLSAATPAPDSSASTVLGAVPDSGSAADGAAPVPDSAMAVADSSAPAPAVGASAQDSSPAPSATAAPDLPLIPDAREPREAGYATIKALHDARAALFVDARSASEYAEAHIPGAVNVPFDDVFKQPDLVKSVDPGGRPIVAYCGGGDCELSKSLAFAFIEAGRRKVLVFTAGLPGWTQAGNPVSKGAQP